MCKKKAFAVSACLMLVLTAVASGCAAPVVASEPPAPVSMQAPSAPAAPVSPPAPSASSAPSPLHSPAPEAEGAFCLPDADAPVYDEKGYAVGYVSPLDVSVAPQLSRFFGKDQSQVQDMLGKEFVYFMRCDHYYKQGMWFRYNETFSDATLLSFGDPQSTFDGQMHTIVLDKDFNGEIAVGLTMQSSEFEIRKQLGSPHYSDYLLGNRYVSGLHVFGYKLRDCYVFFQMRNSTLREVAVYPRSEVSIEDVLTDLEKEVGPVVEQPDSSRDDYSYAANIIRHFNKQLPGFQTCYIFGMKYSDRYSRMCAEYIDKGIFVKFGFWGEEGDDPSDQIRIYLYGNCGLTEAVMNRTKNNPVFVCLPQEDLAFETEKKRISAWADVAGYIVATGEVSPNGRLIAASPLEGRRGVSDYGLYLVSADGQFPSYEIPVNLSLLQAFFWIDDNYLLVDVWMRGLFVYDIRNRELTSVSGMTAKKDWFQRFDRASMNAYYGEGDRLSYKHYHFTVHPDGSLTWQLEDTPKELRQDE